MTTPPGPRPRSDRRGRQLAAAWLVVRAAGIAVLAGWCGYPWVGHAVVVSRDVAEYHSWAQQLYAGALPWHGFNVEYPPGVLAVMLLPAKTAGWFEAEFVALALVADALVARGLWRLHRVGLGSWLWVAVPVLLGPVMWLRLDVFVAAALVGFLVAVRERHWRAAGCCVGAATLLKLWPVLLLVVLWRLLPGEGRRKVAGWSLGVVAAVTLPVLAWGGGSGLWWMLHYQGARGLEVESVWAWPVLVAHYFGAATRPLPGHGGIEVPVRGWASLLGLGLAIGVVALTVAVWRDRHRRVALESAALAGVAVVLVGSKVLSPQYVVWACAVTAIVVDAPALVGRDRRRLAVATVVLAASTQLLYPFGFWWLYFDTRAGVLAATVHALAVLGWLAVVLQVAFRSTAPTGPGPRAAAETPRLGSAEPVLQR
ncbi:MAG TPA: glycosyltransferase 87 family protein [Mycobacteriales bacterium]|nr:glycosyltransferase 87 family protein [Mycobacteriales bacterium]